jgi:predicted AAA+ superfamily ATPase
MNDLPRIYDAILSSHLREHRQMAFLSGPRQVGKTSVARSLSNVYLDWDNRDDRRTILSGPKAVAEQAGLAQIRSTPLVLALDEIHKYLKWKAFLKGFFDTYQADCRIVATGSARMDVFRRGGDSLLGRFFVYRQHPFSIGELLRSEMPSVLVREPRKIDKAAFEALWKFGGFPEPMVRQNEAFYRRWHRSRMDLLLRDDVRDLTRIQELRGIETLGQILAERSGQQIIFQNLAHEISVSVDTAKRWVHTLSDLYIGFELKPWFKNISKALRKEPKWFLRDWSAVSDPGARAETFVACHLLKAVEAWNDLGLGDFELRYLRDKQKREVDFLVVRDGEPWFLVEVKVSETELSPHLFHFQKQTGAPHAFQAVLALDFQEVDCFSRKQPVVVPMKTLLSQLV